MTTPESVVELLGARDEEEEEEGWWVFDFESSVTFRVDIVF